VNPRLARALGIAALSLAATGLFVPRALAQSAPKLAPGVSCTGLTCTNNTKEVYRIEWDAICSDPGTDEPTTLNPTMSWVQPHQTIAMDFTCPFETPVRGWDRDHDRYHRHHHHHDGDNDDVVQGFLVDANYRAAIVDNPRPGPRLPTGSAG
jgi:hypothetical protein